MMDFRPDSQGNRFRAARIAMLRRLIDATLARKSHCRVLDIGGTYNFWHTWRHNIEWERTEVVCVNLNPSHFDEGKDGTRIIMMQGNATNLSNIARGEFDIAFSNSVIEHVGRWSDMVAMASEVKRVAPRYLVQTPYFWFPVEPHSRMPVLHWLPDSWAYRVVMMRKCGYWAKAKTVSQAVATVQSVRMIDAAQMRELFEDAQIVKERFFGITKSLIAIRMGE